MVHGEHADDVSPQAHPLERIGAEGGDGGPVKPRLGHNFLACLVVCHAISLVVCLSLADK
jgi:hypothetical protein